MQRLAQMLEALDRRLQHVMESTDKKLEAIDQTLNAALSAIGDEKVDSEVRYQGELDKKLNELSLEFKKAHEYIKKCLIEAEVDRQKIRRTIEGDDSKKRFS